MELDRLPPANQPAEVGQSRAGLLGFFRPQKTVSPWVQQGSQDLSSATRFCAMPVGRSTAENVQEICPESGSNSAWNNLPEHLIEAIMQMLQEDSPSSASVQHSNKQAIQTQFAATSVSQSWRQIGRRTFFKTLWDQSGAIKHPVQMFGLTPEGLPTQLVKCVVKREYDTARPKAVKYTLRLGDKIGQSSFMMTALQVSRLDMKIFLSSSCQGAPCAHIETNLLGTKYEVMLDRTVQPFAQHQRGHSDTPLVTHDNLPSAQSMHSMRSASCDLDVPVVDLPSTGTPHSSSAAPLLAEADLEPSSPVVEPQCIAQNGIPGDSHTNQQVNTPSPTASGSLLGRVKSARHSRTEAPVQSPFAAMAEGSTADLQAGANLPPLGSMSPASPSFLARYQSAKDSLIASRSSPSAKVPPTPTISPMSTSRIPGRSQSGKVGTNSLPQSSCGDPRCSCHVVPKSVGGIQYKARIHGFMRPRRMKVSLPDPMVLACFDTSASSSSNSHDTSGAQQLRGPTSLLNNPAFVAEAGPSGNSARRMADTAASSDQTPPPRQDPLPAASQSSQQLASGTSTPSQTDSLLPVSPRTPSSSSPKRVELRNKAPHWNDTLRCWCLNFRGRVKLASVKNFQLMKAEDPSKTIVMQFGKVDPYTYIMDYNPAEISTVQAFAISLSTFDTKLLL